MPKQPALILSDPQFSAVVKQTLCTMWKYVLPYRGRFALSLLLGMLSLSTVLEADQIVVMDQGRILDRGTHAELLSRCSLYQKLYHLQFSGDEHHEP